MNECDVLNMYSISHPNSFNTELSYWACSGMQAAVDLQ